MSYFNKFPQVNYSFDNGKTNKLAINILKRVGFKDFTKDNASYFVKYNVMDGDTPEMVASKIYGKSDLHWVVLLFNDIINPYYDWPLSTRKLESYIKKKYPGQAFFLTDESGGTATFADTHFERNWTVLGVDGNTYDDLQNITYGQTNAALVDSWDKTFSKLVVTNVSGDFSTGDFIVAIGTSADGSTYNVGGYLNRLVDSNHYSIHHFENSIDNTILNPLGAPPFGITGEQAVVGHTIDVDCDYPWVAILGCEGYTWGGDSGGITVAFEDTLLQNYIDDASPTFVVTNFEYETERNEEKRTIRLVKPEYIQRITSEFEQLMQGR